MPHREFYSLPEVYDIAFDYRNVPRECDFLSECYAALNGRSPESVLELACGPGAHAREFDRRGVRTAALDLSESMVQYLRERTSPVCELLVGDMADFRLTAPVDLAFTLIDSLPYLTTNQQLISHFCSVREALTPGGVYVVELRHPRDILTGDRSTLNTWSMERDGLQVTVEWGAEVRPDPVAQTEEVLSRLTVEKDGLREVHESWGTLRPLLPLELEALAEAAGGWRVTARYGDLKRSQPLDNSDQSWRCVLVFQKV
ncbi:MAG TPA: class I SAM-dependent methyltransferase [Symbiobacteriaceae bacterium]|nr:class I SAM-dependent methyltransferase [Symbiobacteriaceae bacterium]